MKFDWVSDIHIDIWGDDPDYFGWAKRQNRGSDLLVIGGDTSNDLPLTKRFAERAAIYYPNVILLDGNHEHYSCQENFTTVEKNYDNLREWADSQKTIKFFDGETTFLTDDVLFVGANGWYNFKVQLPDISEQESLHYYATGMNDSIYINFGLSKSAIDWSRTQTDAVIKNVKNIQDDDLVQKIVVCCHTVPDRNGLVWKGVPYWDALNGAYCNTHMEEVFAADYNKKIITVCYGHTHFNFDYIADYRRHVCYPRGYPAETQWKGPLQIDTNEKITKSAFGEVDD